MNKIKEIWKDVPNYEGFYQVSNLGNVKSLSRNILLRGKYKATIKEKILKPLMSKEYYVVILYKDSERFTVGIHVLVAMAFKGHIPNGHKVCVDHINNIKTDNREVNIQLLSNRENCSKDKNGTSKYTGVSWDNSRKKWRAQIFVNEKANFLGRFKTELEAHEAYQKALKQVII